jgi:hypothetical protein
MKTIIEMAQEAGLAIAYDESEEDGWQELEAFAALVRADEREACAKVCDHAAEAEDFDDLDDNGKFAALLLATAIRGRGQA